MSKRPISINDVGIAGEFYMAHILAKYGFKVNVSLGRTEGFDLFIKSPNGRLLTISVKTRYFSKEKEWVLNEKAETLIDENLLYAFVRLNMPDGEPEFWIVPSDVVAKVMVDSHSLYMDTPKRDGTPHKQSSMRLFALGVHRLYPVDWKNQMEGFKGNIESLK